MNTNLGKRNKQAVQVLNQVEYDENGNPIGMKEDRTNPTSANFGTEREPLRGGCYQGDGNAYIEVIGLLATDTVEVIEGSELPIISNDRIDINSGDKVFGIKIFRSGSLWAKFNCSENSGDVCYDSSGNGNHGQIINAITTTPEENPNSIHQYQDVYSFENEEGYSELYNIENSNVNITIPILNIGDQLLFYIKTIDKEFGLLATNTSTYHGIADDTSTANVWSGELGNGDLYVDDVLWYLQDRQQFQAFVSDGKLHKIEYIKTINSINNVSVLKYPSSTFYYSGLSSKVTHKNNLGEVLDTYIPNNSINIIPKDTSITLPPFKDVLGNNLQYVGKVPGKAKFVESSCFLSNGNAYLSGDVLTTDTISAHPESEVPVCTTDGRLDFPTISGKYFDVTIERGSNVVARLPLCEPIIDPSNHTYHDVSGNGNHATLINGTLANNGKQDVFFYDQLGISTSIEVADNRHLTSDLLPRLDDNGTWRNFIQYSTDIITFETFDGGRVLKIDNASNFGSYFSTGSNLLGEFDISVDIFIPNDSLISSVNISFFIDGISSTNVKGQWITLNGVATRNGSFLNCHMQTTGSDGIAGNYYYIRTFSFRKTSQQIPALSTDLTKDALGNPLIIPQDGYSFLNTGTQLQAYDYPALKQADKDEHFWYIDQDQGETLPRKVNHYELALENLMSDKLFIDRTDKY